LTSASKLSMAAKLFKVSFATNSYNDDYDVTVYENGTAQIRFGNTIYEGEQDVLVDLQNDSGCTYLYIGDVGQDGNMIFHGPVPPPQGPLGSVQAMGISEMFKNKSKVSPITREYDMMGCLPTKAERAQGVVVSDAAIQHHGTIIEPTSFQKVLNVPPGLVAQPLSGRTVVPTDLIRKHVDQILELKRAQDSGGDVCVGNILPNATFPYVGQLSVHIRGRPGEKDFNLPWGLAIKLKDRPKVNRKLDRARKKRVSADSVQSMTMSGAAPSAPTLVND
jgi:hypothetical protein